MNKLKCSLPSNVRLLTFEGESNFGINAALYMTTLVYFRPGIIVNLMANKDDSILSPKLITADSDKLPTILGNIRDFSSYFNVPVKELYDKIASQYSRFMEIKSAKSSQRGSFFALYDLISEAHNGQAEVSFDESLGRTATNWVAAVTYHSGIFAQTLGKAIKGGRLYYFNALDDERTMRPNFDETFEGVRKTWGELMSSDDMRQKYIHKYANTPYFFMDYLKDNPSYNNVHSLCTVELIEVEGEAGWHWAINTGVSQLVFDIDFSNLSWTTIARQLTYPDNIMDDMEVIESEVSVILYLLLYPNFLVLIASLGAAVSDDCACEKITEEDIWGKKAIASREREKKAKKEAEAEKKAKLKAEKKAEAERKKQEEYDVKHSVVEAPVDILEYGIATFSATDSKWGRTKRAFRSWQKTATPSDIWDKWSHSLIAEHKDLMNISLNDYFDIWDSKAYYGKLKDEPSMSKLLTEYKKALKNLGYKADPNSKWLQNIVVDAIEHCKVIHSWAKYKQTYHFDKSFPRDTKVDFKTLALLPYSSFCVEIDGQYYFVYLDNYEWEGSLPPREKLGVDASAKAISGYSRHWLDRKTDKELIRYFNTASFMSPVSGTINVALPDALRVHWSVFNSSMDKSWVLDDEAFDRKIGRIINYIANAVNNLDEEAINRIRDKSDYPALGDWGMDMGSDPTSTLRFDWREYLTKYANTDIKE